MKKWFLIVIGLSFATISFSQIRSNANTGKNGISGFTTQERKNGSISAVRSNKQAKKNVLVNFPIELIETDHINMEYEGLPIAEVVSSIENSSNQKKGEFESTLDFNARTAAAMKGKFLGDLTLDGLFGFVVPVIKGRFYSTGLKYDFNPDNDALSLFVLSNSSTINGVGGSGDKGKSVGLDRFDIAVKLDSQETYGASNAYGASVTVEKTVFTEYGIAAAKIPFLNYKREESYSNPSPSVELNMTSSRAAKELPALKALIIMNLTSPYLAYDLYYSKPTREVPTELRRQGKYLTGNVLGIIFYSGRTGEILARLPDNFGKIKP